MAYPFGYNPYGGMTGVQMPMQYGQPAQDQLAQLRQMQSQQPQMQQPQPMAQPQCGIIWVQGEAGAKAFMVAPGNSVPLWDSESQTIYIKTVDAAGIPSMRTIHWHDHVEEPQTASAPRRRQQGEFVTRQEMGALLARLDALEGAMSKEVHGNAESAV